MSYSSEQTRQRIIESAKQEFLEKGFSGASQRSIATSAKVTTGALYNYYKNKEELFATVVKESAYREILGDQAEAYMEKLERFRHAGWRAVIGQ